MILVCYRTVFDILIEADAQALHRKVIYRLCTKMGYDSTQVPEYNDFAGHLQKTSGGNERPAERIRLATQEAFIDFLEKEFSEPIYVRKLVMANFANNRMIRSRVGRPISQSTYLTDWFLENLSRVTDSKSYLDRDGMARVRKLVSDRLPAAIEKYVFFAAGTPYNPG